MHLIQPLSEEELCGVVKIDVLAVLWVCSQVLVEHIVGDVIRIWKYTLIHGDAARRIVHLGENVTFTSQSKLDSLKLTWTYLSSCRQVQYTNSNWCVRVPTGPALGSCAILSRPSLSNTRQSSTPGRLHRPTYILMR